MLSGGGLPDRVTGKSCEWVQECYTLAARGSCEDFQFSSADPPLWRVRARSTSWGTPQKRHEDQAAGAAAGNARHAPATPRRDHHTGRAAKEAMVSRYLCGL